MATIKQQGNGYKITVSNGYDIYGKQLRDHMTWMPGAGMTKKQVEKELSRQAVLFEEKCKSQNIHGGSMRLSEFLTQWFVDYAEKNLKPTTLKTYHTFLPRVNVALGHIKMESLQPKHLLKFYSSLESEDIRLDTKYRSSGDFAGILKQKKLSRAELCKKAGISHGVIESLCTGRNISSKSAEKISNAINIPTKELFAPVSKGKLSGKTKLHYHRFLSAVLETAVQWQIITQNPCARVKAPRAERKETAYMDEHQSASLINALEKEPEQYRTMILLLLSTGLRRGEICALAWEDIDFKSAVLSVRRNAVYTPKSGIQLTTPKTLSSMRAIKLSYSSVQSLEAHREVQSAYAASLGDQWDDNGLVFPGVAGGPMYPDTLTSWFSNFINRHQLPHVTIHGLRHTNASLLIAAGTNLRTVSGRLGHSQASTTANIYAHTIQSADAAAAETIENVLIQNRKKVNVNTK